MKHRLARLVAADQLSVYATAVLVGLQLLMFVGVTENTTLPTVAAVLAGCLLLAPYLIRNFAGWKSFALGALAVATLVVMNRTAPLEVAPGQSRVTLWVASGGITLQLLLLSRRPVAAYSLTILGGVTIGALSSLDFDSYTTYEVGHASLAIACITLILALSKAPASRHSRNQDHCSTPRQARRSVRVAAVLLATVTVTGAMLSTVVAQQLPTMRQWIASQLRLPLPTQSARRITGISTDGWIGSVAASKQVDSMLPTLRVYSHRVPGYLKTRTFNSFTGKRWLPLRRNRRLLKNATLPSSPPRGGVFRIGDNDGNGLFRTLRIENQKGLETLFFSTLETTFLETPGNAVRIDANGSVVEATEKKSYTLHLSDPEAITTVDSSINEACLRIPQRLNPDLKRLAEEVVGDASTDAEKIEAISQYLKETNVYSLDPFRYPKDMDPVSYFLLNKRPGHCEYFATGTAILLRHVGVSSRYAIGFLTTELEDEYQDYWLARNRDAHAWVEAFDRERGRWVLVDSTPGSEFDDAAESRSTVGPTDGPSGSENDAGLAQWGARLMAQLRRPITWLIGIIVIAAIVYLWRRSIWSITDPIQARRVWLDRRLRRRGLTRQPAETLHQFAKRIEARAEEDGWLRAAAQWQVSYATYRFGGGLVELSDPRSWKR